MKVNFVGVGASRSGSTWLSECLREHPEVCFSEPKETHFFDDDNHYSKGYDYYHSFFSCRTKLYGEYTPGYFTNHKTAQRIYEYNPEMKIIVLLRNPIDRAFSEYLYNKGREYETLETFEAAIEGPRAHRYLPRGHYFEHLIPYYDTFPRNQIFVRLYDDILEHPQRLWHELLVFLELDTNFTPTSLTKVINSSNDGRDLRYVPGFTHLIRTLRNNNAVKVLMPFFRAIHLNQLVQYLQHKNLKKLRTDSNTTNITASPTTQSFLSEYYRKEMERAGELVGRDLPSYWL